MQRYIFFFLIISSPLYAQSWERAERFGGAGDNNAGEIVRDRQSNLIISGSSVRDVTIGGITLSGNGFGRFFFIAKYDGNGNPLWARTIAEPLALYTPTNLTSISVTPAGEIYFAGTYQGSAKIAGNEHTAVSPTEIFFGKLDASGAPLWVRKAGGSGIGNFNQNIVYAIASDSSGDAIISGRFNKDLNFGSIEITANLPAEFFIAKFSAGGTPLWAHTGGGDFGIHYATALAIGEANSIYAAGAFFGHLTFGGDTIDAVDAEQKIFLANYDAAGSLQWSEKAGSGGYYGSPEHIAFSGGSLFLAGFFRAQMNLDGGNSLVYSNGLQYAVLLMKFRADNGGILWGRQSTGANQNAIAYGIEPENGELYVAGRYLNELTLGTKTLPNQSGSFVATLDTSGNFKNALAPVGASAAYSLVRSGSKTIVTGDFAETLTFGDHSISSADSTDGYIAWLSDAPDEVKLPENIQPKSFPNPFSAVLHTSYSGKIQLRDVLGRVRKQCESCCDLDVRDLQPGVYFLNGEKVVKQ